MACFDSPFIIFLLHIILKNTEFACKQMLCDRKHSALQEARWIYQEQIVSNQCGLLLLTLFYQCWQTDRFFQKKKKKIQLKHPGKWCSSFSLCFWKYSIMLASTCTTPDHHSFSKVTAESPPISSLIKSFLGWSSLDAAVLGKSPEPEHFNLQS